MKKKEIIMWSFINSVGVLVYVALVATIIQNGEKIFGKMKNFAGPIAFLLLFVFSALVTGLLVLGRPVYLFLDGSKKEAVKMLLYTVGWMFLIMVLVLVINIVLK
jgi:hypothetical protein